MWSPAIPARPDPLTTEIAAVRRASYLADLSRDHGRKRATVPLVAWTLPEQRPALMVDFFTRRGCQFAVFPDGSLSSEEDITPAIWDFECMFTLDARLIQLNDDQHRVLLEYWSEFLGPALRAAGYDMVDVQGTTEPWSMAWYPRPRSDWSEMHWAEFKRDYPPYPNSAALLGNSSAPPLV